jgi:hypothetical protein
MTDDHIVEVYAAADSFEAERLREHLADAGIQTTIVGDEINHVAGSMPYGGIASPRLWVHERDKDAAAELIEEWLANKAGADTTATDSNEPSSESDVEEESDQEVAPAEVEGISAFGKLLMLLGFGCILLGASFGWSNYQIVEAYSEQTEARQVGIEPTYQYQVQDKTYTVHLSTVSSAADIPATVTVHFKPGNPGERLVGELPSPALPIVFGTFFGVLIMFIVYRLN